MCLLWSEGVICYSRVGEAELSQWGNDNIHTVPGSGSSAEPGAATAEHRGAATHRKHPSSRSLRRGNNYVSYVLLITICWNMEEVSDDCGHVCLKTLSSRGIYSLLSVLGHRPPSKKSLLVLGDIPVQTVNRSELRTRYDYYYFLNGIPLEWLSNIESVVNWEEIPTLLTYG